ncbi:MAG: NfeD family protein [Bacteroidota bacterium]
MSLTAIILLILIGLVLLVLEILFVPGMVLGIISVMLMIVGVIFAYRDFGTTTGTLVLSGTAVATFGAVYWAFRSNVWKKLQVQSSMEGKANVLKVEILVGDTGRTISRLNPIGKAFIRSQQVEVQALDGFIDQDTEITVAKVQQNKIFVRQK